MYWATCFANIIDKYHIGFLMSFIFWLLWQAYKVGKLVYQGSGSLALSDIFLIISSACFGVVWGHVRVREYRDIFNCFKRYHSTCCRVLLLQNLSSLRYALVYEHRIKILWPHGVAHTGLQHLAIS